MTDVTSAVPNEASIPAGPGDAPREVSGVVRWRAWGEPGVRIWWLAGVALLVVAGYLAGLQVQARWRGQRLMEQGLAVDALVKEVNGTPVAGQSGDADSMAALMYKVDGQEYWVMSKLEGRTERIVVGKTVPIRVDREDPHIWTARQTTPALWRELVGPAILLPEALAALLVSWGKRARLLRLWRRGEAVLAVVTERRQTALAPLSAAARCTPRNAKDQRVFDVFLGKAKAAKVGEAVWLVAQGKRAVAAGVLG